jgi:hypothetical protein
MPVRMGEPGAVSFIALTCVVSVGEAMEGRGTAVVDGAASPFATREADVNGTAAFNESVAARIKPRKGGEGR